MDFELQLYGRGFKFPFQFDPSTGGVAQDDGVSLVRNNLAFILNTLIGERYMNPTFGSRIGNALFMLDTDQQRSILRGYVNEALAQEPRVETIGDITVEGDAGDPHAIVVNIAYRLVNQLHDDNVIIPLRGI
jgi:Bacteriophage baseplate protein W